jgi:hypothetical protein
LGSAQAMCADLTRGSSALDLFFKAELGVERKVR